MGKTGVAIIVAAALLIVAGFVIWKLDSDCDAYRARVAAEVDKFEAIVGPGIFTQEMAVEDAGEPPLGCSI